MNPLPFLGASALLLIFGAGVTMAAVARLTQSGSQKQIWRAYLMSIVGLGIMYAAVLMLVLL